MMKNKLRGIFFLSVIVIQIAFCVYYATFKTNLFMDEFYSFNLANSYYEPFLGRAVEYMNRWIDSETWLQKLMVQQGREFSYDSVFYNQAKDVHPPLYYVIIHTICSFFPNQFSIWFGIVPNIIFFIGTQIFLLKISDKLFDNKWIAVLVCILYGFSWGAINTVIYIRMYMMLTFFGVLSFWVHLLLFDYYNKYKQLKGSYLAAIFVITICGFLTQYYYAIFAFFLSGIFSIWLLKDLERKLFAKYAATASGAIITSIVIFPAFLQQLFGGYRGKEAIKNLSQTDIWNRLKTYINIIDTDLFGNLLIFIAGLLIIYFIVKLVCSILVISIKSQEKKYILNIQFNKVWKIQTNYTFEYSIRSFVFLGIILFLTCTFLVIVKIVPYLNNRYIFMLYPFVSIILVKIYYKYFYNTQRIKYSIFIVIFLLIVSCINVYSPNNIKDSNVWKNSKQIERIIEEKYPNINVVLISGSNSWFPANSQLYQYSKTNQTLIINQKDCKKLKSFIKGHTGNKAIIVYIGKNVKNEKDIINTFAKLTPYKHFNKIDSNTGKTYLFTKSKNKKI